MTNIGDLTGLALSLVCWLLCVSALSLLSACFFIHLFQWCSQFVFPLWLCIAASSLAGWVMWSVLCVCLFGFCVFVGKITQTPLSQISWRWRDGGEMRHDQRKNLLSFGPDQFFISFMKKALASVEREIAISVWSAGLLSLFQCGSLEHSPCCSFCFSGGQCHPGANPGLLAVSWDSAFSLVWLHSQQV